MAKKKFNPLEDPPTASSSDEDEVEALSGEDEEEEQISDDSSSEEDDDLMNPINIPPVTKSKTPSAAVASGSKKPIKEKEVHGSPAMKSGKKRPIESTSSKDVNAKRSKKVSEETKKPYLFQRVWSEEDEISLLQGMIDYKAETGDSPYDDMDKFYELTRKAIRFEASKNQFFDKIRSLKKKYTRKLEKGVESLKTAHDIECFELFKCIWGSHGIALESAVKSNVKKTEEKKRVKPHGRDVEEVVVALESAVKSNVTPKKSEKKPISMKAKGDNVGEDREVLVNVEEDREVLVSGEKVEEDKAVLVNGEKVEEDKEVLVTGKKVEEVREVLVNGGDPRSLGVRASDWFEDSFLVGSIASLGVSEQFVNQKWSMVAVETKKRMEEKWKLLQAKEMELVLQKTDFMREVGSVIAEVS